MLAVLSGNKDATAITGAAAYNGSFLVIAALCLAAMAFDLAQYLFGYISVKATLDHAQAKKLTETTYTENWLMDLRFAAFYAKQGLAILAALWLIGVLGLLVGKTH